MKNKIKVSFERIFEVEPINEKARPEEIAKEKMIEYIEERLKENNPTWFLSAEKYTEPTNWIKSAEEDGQHIAEDLSEEIIRAVNDWKKNNKESMKVLKELDFCDIYNEVNEIFDQIDSQEDIRNIAIETADGSFIYQDSKSVKNALDCINDLSAYEETDWGLWENIKEVEGIINIKATWTLANAIQAEAETTIKGQIKNALTGFTK